MRVFRVSSNHDQCQTIMPTNEDSWGEGVLDFCGRSKTNWKAPEFFVFNPLAERGNFFHLHPGALVFDERAMEKLADIFEMAGQILSFTLEKQMLFILNVTECCNALNQQATAWRQDPRTGQRSTIRSYSFHGNRYSESSIFKIPETHRAEVLTYADIKDEDEEFLGRYQRANLTGLDFDLLYQD